MAKKSIPAQRKVRGQSANSAEPAAQLLAEFRSLKLDQSAQTNRNDKVSILLNYIYAVADILTTENGRHEPGDGLASETLDQLQWLQLELADQAKAIIDGYMPADVPSFERPWVQVERRAPE